MRRDPGPFSPSPGHWAPVKGQPPCFRASGGTWRCTGSQVLYELLNLTSLFHSGEYSGRGGGVSNHEEGQKGILLPGNIAGLRGAQAQPRG